MDNMFTIYTNTFESMVLLIEYGTDSPFFLGGSTFHPFFHLFDRRLVEPHELRRNCPLHHPHAPAVAEKNGCFGMFFGLRWKRHIHIMIDNSSMYRLCCESYYLHTYYYYCIHIVRTDANRKKLMYLCILQKPLYSPSFLCQRLKFMMRQTSGKFNDQIPDMGTPHQPSIYIGTSSRI